jgi:hypothetical protein
MKKPKRSKKEMNSSKRTKVAVKPVKKTKVAQVVTPAATSATEPAATPVTRSKAARASIAEGTRLFALARRPTREQFILVYGEKGPRMTWAERAKAGVDAKHFQQALAAKSWAKQDRPSVMKMAGGLTVRADMITYGLPVNHDLAAFWSSD